MYFEIKFYFHCHRNKKERFLMRINKRKIKLEQNSCSSITYVIEANMCFLNMHFNVIIIYAFQANKYIVF